MSLEASLGERYLPSAGEQSGMSGITRIAVAQQLNGISTSPRRLAFFIMLMGVVGFCRPVVCQTPASTDGRQLVPAMCANSFAADSGPEARKDLMALLGEGALQPVRVTLRMFEDVLINNEQVVVHPDHLGGTSTQPMYLLRGLVLPGQLAALLREAGSGARVGRESSLAYAVYIPRKERRVPVSIRIAFDTSELRTAKVQSCSPIAADNGPWIYVSTVVRGLKRTNGIMLSGSVDIARGREPLLHLTINPE